MNERIRELAEQCYEEFQTLTSPKYLVFNKEKFAELIVKQCAQLADDCPDDYLRQPYKYPSTYIKEHFGVKL